MRDDLKEIHAVTTHRTSLPDDVFICCASFEDRCRGVVEKFSSYRYQSGFMFVYDDPDKRREENVKLMLGQLQKHGKIIPIPSSEKDPVPSIRTLLQILSALNLDPNRCVLTLDITTFTKRHLLLLLRALDQLGFWDNLRILYTEPFDYVVDLYLPMSMGVKQIHTLPGFTAGHSLNHPTLLVIFLGYEGDRALAFFNNLDPNETLLIVPKPAYHSEWEGRTEQMNHNLISLLGEDHIRYAHSRNATSVASTLAKVLEKTGLYSLEKWNCCIAPFGTKPQALGLYMFWRENKAEVSIAYAQPLRHSQLCYSKDIGGTWLLKQPS